MRHQTTIRSAGRWALLALVLASTWWAATTVHAGIRTLTDPSTTFTYWTRLPGGRLLWLSKRPACRPALSPMECQADGRTDDPRLSVMYYQGASSPVEYAFRLPQR